MCLNMPKRQGQRFTSWCNFVINSATLVGHSLAFAFAVGRSRLVAATSGITVPIWSLAWKQQQRIIMNQRVSMGGVPESISLSSDCLRACRRYCHAVVRSSRRGWCHGAARSFCRMRRAPDAERDALHFCAKVVDATHSYVRFVACTLHARVICIFQVF